MSLLHESVLDSSGTDTIQEVTINPDQRVDNGAEQTHEFTPEQKFAKDAVSRFFNWIKESPSNPDYLDSQVYKQPRDWLEAHGHRLEQDITTRLNDLTYDNVPADMAHFWRLFYGEPDRDQNGKIVHKMFTSTDIAYAGIKDIVEKARHYTLDAPIEQIDTEIVQSIGATIVREYYFKQLAALNPRELPAEQLADFNEKLQGFYAIYQQNIVSEIQRAGLLHQQATNQQPIPQPAA